MAWNLGTDKMEQLLRESQQFKGESLWQDAWRRLKRNRTAYWSMVFLLGFMFLSLGAPLLPMPSPESFQLERQLLPPQVPGLDKGAWGGKSWRHTTTIEFVAESLDGEQLKLSVEEITGRPALTSGPQERKDGRVEMQILLPMLFADAKSEDSPGLEPQLKAIPVGDSLEMLSCTARSSYNWPLSGIDRWAIDLRAQVFGHYCTGPLLGTDFKGRDMLSRIIWGSRTSILVAIIATLCSLIIGVTYGALSGLLGGRIDNLMMRLVDVMYSIPFIFVVIFLITLVNEYRTELEKNFGINRELIFYLVIGAIYWLTMARVVRGQVLQLKHAEFIEATRVIGASKRRILFLHLVPNVLSIVIVYLTLTIPAVMLFEAFLSFLGLGIEPPKVSWGLLAVDGTEAISPLKTYWWIVLFPAMAMGSTLLALNVLGDGLRDALDPKLRGKD